MKQRFAIIAFILLCVTVFPLHSCREEAMTADEHLTEGDEYQEALQAAMHFYEFTTPATSQTRLVMGHNMKEKLVKPVWGESYLDEDDRYSVLEVGLLPMFSFNLFLPENQNEFMKTHDSRYITSTTRFIFRTRKDSGVLDMFYMTVIPSASYVKKQSGDLFKNMSYLHRDKNFSGLVLFHNADGGFSNGWLYEKGKVVKTVEMIQSAGFSKTRMAMAYVEVLEDVYYEYETRCWTWTATCGSYSYDGMECSDYEIRRCSYQTFVFEGDFQDFSEGDGGGGGGGYAPYLGIPSNESLYGADPCKQIEKIYADSKLLDELQNLGKDRLGEGHHEAGFTATKDRYYYTTSGTTTSCSYGKQSLEGEYKAQVHTHPGLSRLVPSASDITSLYKKRKHINPDDFIYGTKGPNGLLLFVISDSSKFYNFAKSLVDEPREKENYNRYFSLIAHSEEEKQEDFYKDILEFKKYIIENDIGLNIICSPHNFGDIKGFSLNSIKMDDNDYSKIDTINCNKK